MNESYNFGISRPTSGFNRPQSAASSKSGAANKSITSQKDKNSNEENFQQTEIKMVSDEFGVVLFKKIPSNVYELEVPETHNFLGEKRVTLIS